MPRPARVRGRQVGDRGCQDGCNPDRWRRQRLPADEARERGVGQECRHTCARARTVVHSRIPAGAACNSLMTCNAEWLASDLLKTHNDRTTDAHRFPDVQLFDISAVLQLRHSSALDTGDGRQDRRTGGWAGAARTGRKHVEGSLKLALAPRLPVLAERARRRRRPISQLIAG